MRHPNKPETGNHPMLEAIHKLFLFWSAEKAAMEPLNEGEYREIAFISLVNPNDETEFIHFDLPLNKRRYADAPSSGLLMCLGRRGGLPNALDYLTGEWGMRLTFERRYIHAIDDIHWTESWG